MKKFRDLGIVLVLTFVVFFPSLSGEFLAFDDELLILDNPTVHGLTFSNIQSAFTTYDPELYIPLTLLTHQIEWSLAGDSPALYHITNLLIHLASAVLVFLILRRFFSVHISVVCALLFSIHPLQVETVAWISGRKDLLASAFFLASTYTYLQWKGTGQHKSLSLVFFLCGLMSKVSIFPLPISLLLLDYLRGERLSGDHVKEKLPYFLLSGIFLIIAVIGKSTQVSDPISAIVLTPASVLLTIKHIVIPTGLTIFYPFTNTVVLTNPLVLSGLVFFVLTGVGCAATHKRSRYLTFSVLWFAVLIAPSLLNMQKGGELGIPDLYLTSDRYAYLALIGPIFLFGYLLRKLSWYPGALLVLVFGSITFVQTSYWQNSDALFRRAIDVGQKSHVAFTNIGGYAAQSGNFEEAEELFTQSLSIRRSTRALYNLAQIKVHLGKKEEGLELYRELLLLTPNDDSARRKMQSIL